MFSKTTRYNSAFPQDFRKGVHAGEKIIHMPEKRAIVDYDTLLEAFLPVPSGKVEPSAEAYSAALDFNLLPTKGRESYICSSLVGIRLQAPRAVH